MPKVESPKPNAQGQEPDAVQTRLGNLLDIEDDAVFARELAELADALVSGGGNPNHGEHGRFAAAGHGGGSGSGEKVYRETRVPVNHQIFSLLGIKEGNVFADYEALRAKHPDQFKVSGEVKKHVEKVMSEPHYILPGAENDHRLIVHQAGESDKAAILEIELRGGKYRIQSAYTLTLGQLVTKIKKAGGEGAESPVLRVDRLSAKHLQGAGVPCDTLPPAQKG